MVSLTDSPVADLLQKQRAFFASGQTRDLRYRLTQLQRLKQAVLDQQDPIMAALAADLGKPPFESYAADIGVIEEIQYAMAHLRRWAAPQTVSVPWKLWPGMARIAPEPRGVVLIIAPWNYPVLLTLGPLAAAIAAGNCAILKPSEWAPRTSRVMAQLIGQLFDPAYVAVVEGGIEVSQALLQEPFGHILFTGSPRVGRIVMAAAAQTLTPVTLELGGKSPCWLDRDVALPTAIRRIVWGKFLNAGQSCVAPDYLLVPREGKKAILATIRQQIHAFYGDNPATSPDYGRIVSREHVQRLAGLIQGEVVIGGEVDETARFVAPTVIDNVTWDHPAMQEEIFGPILPVLTYDTWEDAIAHLRHHPHPLTLYAFSHHSERLQQLQQSVPSGSLCINDTMTHMAIPALPFGGIGTSGMGAYHGKAGFDTFSHYRSVFQKPFWLDLALRYPPYGANLRWLKRLIR